MVSIQLYSRQTGWVGAREIRNYTSRSFDIHVDLFKSIEGKQCCDIDKDLIDNTELRHLMEINPSWYVYKYGTVITEQSTI